MPIEIDSDKEQAKSEAINYDRIDTIVRNLVKDIAPDINTKLDTLIAETLLMNEQFGLLYSEIQSVKDTQVDPEIIQGLATQLQTLNTLAIAIGTAVGNSEQPQTTGTAIVENSVLTTIAADIAYIKGLL